MTSRYVVPVEHRWWGLDRRKLPLTIGIVAVMVVLVWVLPWLNSATAWDDEIAAGDVIDMGGGTTFVPPVGWQLERGIRTSDEPIVPVSTERSAAVLVRGGVTLRAALSTFAGTTDELLTQVNSLRDGSDDGQFTVTGPRQTITTHQGLTGISEAYTAHEAQGRVVAFTWDSADAGRLGLVVTVDTTGDNDALHAREIDAVLQSITVTEAGS